MQLGQTQGRLEVVVERTASIHLTEPGGYTEGILLIGRSVVPRKAPAEERRVNFGDNTFALRHVEAIEWPEVGAQISAEHLAQP